MVGIIVVNNGAKENDRWRAYENKVGQCLSKQVDVRFGQRSPDETGNHDNNKNKKQ